MNQSPPHLSQQSQYAWRGALVACSLNAIGMPLDILVARGIPNMPAWPPLMSSATGVLLVSLMLARRRHPTMRLAATVFLTNTVVILVALWITSGVYVTAPGKWIPFQANKLGALAAGVLAPDLVMGIVAIAGFTGMALIKYQTFPPDQQHRLPIGEPWVIVIYAAFALAILGYRVHSIALSRRMFRIRAEMVATRRLARTFLALRDFTNTPLQTIELAAQIIRKRCPDQTPLLDRIERSLERLYRLNRAFSAYESHIEWTDHEVSPDVSAVVDPDDARA